MSRSSALLAAPLLAACGVGMPSIPVARFAAGDIEAVADIVRAEVDQGPAENQALVLNVLAQCEQLLGDHEAAWRHFEVAGRIMGNWQTSGSEEFAAIVGSESSKTYKGDPYEKAMNAFYAGLNYLWRGEPDNARACMKRGILADGEVGDEKYRADFALLYWLAGRMSLLMGSPGDAEDFFAEAKQADEFARLNGSRGDAAARILDRPAAGNLVLLVECGLGPEKYSDGAQGELARFRPRASSIATVRARLGDRDLGEGAVLADLYYQAVTRGGTEMEGIRQGKAVLKTVSTVSGIVLLESAADDHGNSARNKAIAGGVLLLLGLLTSSSADVRHWPTLPDTVHVLTADVPPGEHELRLEFLDRSGVRLPELDQTWTVTVAAGSESFHLFRSIPGLDRLAAQRSQSAASQNAEKLP